ncbi:MAG: family 3 adenylate cyclase [Gemmatimonadota bacterium]
MAKFPSDRFPPGFFDLPSDAGEVLPLELIERWTHSPQTRDVAHELLAPRTLTGTVVSSDSAGLTRLSRERSLVEILAMVNRPKEIVHAYGTAIGGRTIGVWAADNTQMFYPADVPAERVVGMLRGLLERLPSESEVGIGLCAHRGVFFELSGGLYGPDADRVEVVAEEHTAGSELLITDVLADRLPTGHGFVLEPRADLLEHFGAVFRVTGGPALTDLAATDFRYPAPFSDDFYSQLSAYGRTRRDSVVPHPVYQDRTVVLIEREREELDIPEVAVLNDLALSAAMKRIGNALLRGFPGVEIKTSGLIALYVFDDAATGTGFARAFRDAFAEQGVATRTGLDAGPVLVFELGRGTRDIAGSPVNVASKLAQDCGSFGSIYLSEAVAAKLPGTPPGRAVEFAVSGITLSVREL